MENQQYKMYTPRVTNKFCTDHFIGIDIINGQYQVIERIGTGSFGEVFKVQDNIT